MATEERWLQTVLAETWKALHTPGGRPCLYGLIDPNPYLEGDWRSHRYMLVDPRPAWAPQSLGLPRSVSLIPSGPLIDSILRAYAGQRVHVMGRHASFSTVRGERVPVLTVTNAWPQRICPPPPPLTPPTPETREEALARLINFYLQQVGMPPITPAQVDQWLPWLQQQGIDVDIAPAPAPPPSPQPPPPQPSF